MFSKFITNFLKQIVYVLHKMVVLGRDSQWGEYHTNSDRVIVSKQIKNQALTQGSSEF